MRQAKRPEKFLPFCCWLSFIEDVEVLHGVIQDDACHCDSSQGIGNIYACIG
jgi:hypothetical protein